MFIKANVLCINNVAEACISAVRPLKIGDFGFVYTKNAIMAAQGTIPVEFLLVNYLFILHGLLVIALYSKMAGKNAKHGAITDSSTIAAVSVYNYSSTCMDSSFVPSQKLPRHS